MKAIRARFGLMAAVAVLVASTALAAAQVSIIKTRGKTAHATYFQYTEGFCKGLSLEVFGGTNMTKVNDTRTFEPSLFVQVSEFNNCTGEFAFYSGSTSTLALRIRPDLDPADVSGSLEISDGMGGVKHVSVDLHWAGGEYTSDRNRTVTTSPTGRTVVRTFDAIRSGSTVTGSLQLDGVELLSPDNVTDQSSLTGFVTRSTGATIEIIRGN